VTVLIILCKFAQKRGKLFALNKVSKPKLQYATITAECSDIAETMISNNAIANTRMLDRYPEKVAFFQLIFVSFSKGVIQSGVLSCGFL